MIKKILKIVLRTILFVILTALTQIGGIVFLLSLVLNRLWRQRFLLKPVITFLGLYIVSTFVIVPLISPIFGREKIVHTECIKPATYMTDLLNRNYVKSEINQLLKEAESSIQESGINIMYLDANFPFLDNFPLPPHLSHNDGKKIDFALVYQHQNGDITNKQKSLSGYGVFVEPKRGETNQIKKCLESGHFQYDYPKYFTFGQINKDLEFSEYGTKKLIESLLKSDYTRKVFIEPHLKERLGLTDTRIRYHGCKSVRHDDHIHLQIK